MTVEIGRGAGSGSGLIRLDTNDKQTLLEVLTTSGSLDGNLPALDWYGTHASNVVRVQAGSVGIASVTYGDLATVATLIMGYTSSIDSDAQVTIGADVTLGTVTKTGGVLITSSGATVLDHRAGTATLDGAGVFPSLDISGGEVSSLTSGILGAYGAITGITAADPAVVTSASHGLTTGDQVRIASVVGMIQVNQTDFTIEVVNANSFKLVGIDSSAYTAYSSGGYWGKVGSVVVSGNGKLDFAKSAEARQVSADIFLYGSQASVTDPNDVVSTLTRLTGQFGVKQFGGERFGDMGGDSGAWFRQV